MKKLVYIALLIMFGCGGAGYMAGDSSMGLDQDSEFADIAKAQSSYQDSESFFPLNKGLTWNYRNTWIDYNYYKNELVDISVYIPEDNVRVISFEGTENISDSPTPYEGKLIEYYRDDFGKIQLYKSETKITYYGDDMQVVVYEINYAPAMTLLEDSTDIRLGDKYSTKTQVTLYIKEEGSAFLTYDFPVTVDVSVTDSRTMLVEDEEVEVFELTIKDAYNWSNIETYCEKSKRTDKYICPSEKFKPKFLTRKLYLAKGIGPVRFVGEENVFGFGDWVDRANSEPIIDIIDRY